MLIDADDPEESYAYIKIVRQRSLWWHPSFDVLEVCFFGRDLRHAGLILVLFR